MSPSVKARHDPVVRRCQWTAACATLQLFSPTKKFKHAAESGSRDDAEAVNYVRNESARVYLKLSRVQLSCLDESWLLCLLTGPRYSILRDDDRQPKRQ